MEESKLTGFDTLLLFQLMFLLGKFLNYQDMSWVLTFAPLLASVGFTVVMLFTKTVIRR